MSKSAEDAVREFLTTRGHALELQTARMLLQTGLPVQQSVIYRDPETGKRRETDVVVELIEGRQKGWRVLSGTTLVVAECKHTQAGSWVGVQHECMPPRGQSQPADWFTVGGDHQQFGDAVAAGLVTPGSAPCAEIFAVGENQKNSAYDAVRQALAATSAIAHARLPVETDEDTLQTSYRGAAWAAVVTTAPLFKASLTDLGTIEVVPSSLLEVMVDERHAGRRVPVLVFSPEGFAGWAARLVNHG